MCSAELWLLLLLLLLLLAARPSDSGMPLLVTITGARTAHAHSRADRRGGSTVVVVAATERTAALVAIAVFAKILRMARTGSRAARRQDAGTDGTGHANGALVI